MGDLYVHIDPKLTDEQEGNFLRLARHLILASRAPDWVPENFQMGTTIYDLTTGDELKPADVSETSGPMLLDPLGHAVVAGIAPLPEESWIDYQTRVLGAPFDSPLEWWLLSSRWWHTDNTPVGAAMRLLYVLDYGVPHDHVLVSEGMAQSDYLDNSFLWDRVELLPENV